MLRFYFRFTLILTLLLLVFSAAMQALGGAQPINPALRGFVEGCEGVERLCWYGIVSYETTLSDAQIILANAGYVLTQHLVIADESAFGRGYYEDVYYATGNGCNTLYLNYGLETTIPRAAISRLENCSNLYLADVIEALGQPRRIEFFYNTLHYDDGLYVIFLGREPEWYATISQIHLNNVNWEQAGLITPGGGRDWRGFYPLWWYCAPLRISDCLGIG